MKKHGLCKSFWLAQCVGLLVLHYSKSHCPQNALKETVAPAPFRLLMKVLKHAVVTQIYSRGVGIGHLQLSKYSVDHLINYYMLALLSISLAASVLIEMPMMRVSSVCLSIASAIILLYVHLNHLIVD